MAWLFLGIAGLLEVLWAYMLKISDGLTKPVEAAVAIECIAHMALMTMQLAPKLKEIEPELLDRHFKRKHGPNAYYGQVPKTS